ncbi:hypothetical protein GF406_00440 [candidate division KSB1 bacterium]|jgi:hypothetical protein|nr:hypothetical protein [candidate division KSB1 bacterium]
MDSFYALLVLALIIERLLEIGVVLIPGLEDTKLKLKDTLDYKQFVLKLKRGVLVAGMVLGMLFCFFLNFGILNSVFPEQISASNRFDHLITGIIAGSGSEPVHHIIKIIIGIRQKLIPSRAIE